MLDAGVELVLLELVLVEVAVVDVECRAGGR